MFHDPADAPAERYPEPAPDRLPADQREAWDRIVQARGKLPRPLRSVLASPRVAEQIEALSRTVREGVLPQAVIEALYLCVACRNRCRFQWDAHAGRALEVGVSAADVDRLQVGLLPEGSVALVAAITFADELLRLCHVRADTFEAARRCFGERGLAELQAMVGVASTISFLLNAQAAPD